MPEIPFDLLNQLSDLIAFDSTPADMLKSVYDMGNSSGSASVDLADAILGGSAAGKSKYYGTDPAGVLGFNDLPSSGSGVGQNFIINPNGIINQRNSAYTLAKNVYNWDINELTGPDRFEGMATGTLVTAGTYNNIATANCGVSGYAFKFIAITLTGAGEIHFRYRMEAKDAIKFKNQTA